jgi:hypothetical protein
MDVSEAKSYEMIEKIAKHGDVSFAEALCSPKVSASTSLPVQLPPARESFTAGSDPIIVLVRRTCARFKS